MKVIDTLIPDVKILEPKIFGDDRGLFFETFKESWFKQNVSNVNFVQDNQSKSSQGILRGLHYQINNPQGKLVRVVAGEVFDVAVDMRIKSPTFGLATYVVLSEENKRQLWIPEGFAHGFYVISRTAEFVYKCTDYYAPKHERCLLWSDSYLNIEWPLIANKKPELSDKDTKGLEFINAEYFE